MANGLTGVHDFWKERIKRENNCHNLQVFEAQPRQGAELRLDEIQALEFWNRAGTKMSQRFEARRKNTELSQSARRVGGVTLPSQRRNASVASASPASRRLRVPEPSAPADDMGSPTSPQFRSSPGRVDARAARPQVEGAEGANSKSHAFAYHAAGAPGGYRSPAAIQPRRNEGLGAGTSLGFDGNHGLSGFGSPRPATDSARRSLMLKLH